MRAWTLGSGSRGNAILLESDGTRVLVDVGYAPRTIARRLAAIGVAPESIEAVIVTHEHSDHARGVQAARAKWGWRVIGTAGTLQGIAGLAPSGCTSVAQGIGFAVGAIDFTLVRVPHDAAAPAAFLATARSSGFRTGLAHDLGSVPEALRAAFAAADLLLMESNHDTAMLRSGPYPAFLQDRIAGGKGHLSNRQAAAAVREVATKNLRDVVLLHLSETNNTPNHAVRETREALRGSGCAARVHAAGQDEAAGPFGGKAATRSRQLALAL